MRFRQVLAATGSVLVLTAAATGCTSDKKPTTPHITTGSGGSTVPVSPTPSIGPINDYCVRLIAASAKITTAQAGLYSGDHLAINVIVAQLTSLQNGAPAQIKDALASMIIGFRAADAVVAHPTDENKAKLTTLLTGLSKNGQQISNYVAAKCTVK